MKNIIFILFLLFICQASHAQKSFEGSIKFKVEISTTELATADFKANLYKKYGDSLIMLYSNNGNFKRQFLNTGDFGYDNQIYDAKKGMLYIKKKNSIKIDSGNVKINSITKLISKRKINNETIMNLDCECFEYVGVSKNNQHVTINYCFSKNTPKIDSSVFEKHNDFFLNEFYKSAERPYLKYSLQTEKFKLINIATEIRAEKIDDNVFEIK